MTISASDAHKKTQINIETLEKEEPISIAHYVESIDIAIDKAISNRKFEIVDIQLCYDPVIISDMHMDAIQKYYQQLGYGCGWFWGSTLLLLSTDVKCWYINWEQAKSSTSNEG